MKFRRLSRRQFLATGLLATPIALCADARYIEPTRVAVNQVRIGNGPPVARLVHFTDLHHKGDRDYLQSVVDKINTLAPDFVCLTGDLIEEQKFLAETLEILSGIRVPLFGVPGNHDYWSKAAFEPIHQ